MIRNFLFHFIFLSALIILPNLGLWQLDRLEWKNELLNEASDTKDDLSEDGLQRPDIADRAQVESDASIQLRTRDRERKLSYG